ncbi:MAG: hypothetical protein EXQ92_12240 [Alphaproteobacteria bacterium]|nr:hypothetical protein [Alphaproteobacteria bacterium]
MIQTFPLAAIVLPGAAISLVLAIALLHMGNRANILRASLWWAFAYVLNAMVLVVPIALQIADPVRIMLSVGAGWYRHRSRQHEPRHGFGNHATRA